MKTKKFSKKLTLNKKTIADLNNGEMKVVRGGINEPPRRVTETCQTCDNSIPPGTCCTIP